MIDSKTIGARAGIPATCGAYYCELAETSPSCPRNSTLRVIDCAFRGVEGADELQHTGGILFSNVHVEPAVK